jgi:hypothetical protein
MPQWRSGVTAQLQMGMWIFYGVQISLKLVWFRSDFRCKRWSEKVGVVSPKPGLWLAGPVSYGPVTCLFAAYAHMTRFIAIVLEK